MALVVASDGADDVFVSKQITVGYDGSAASSEAVLWAADEAVVRGASLRIVSCYQIPLAGDLVLGWAATEAFAALLEATEAALSLAKANVSEGHGELDVSTKAQSEPAGSGLIEGTGPDDLIVVGASHHEGAAAFWLGSTARYVVRHSPCPVVVVRGAASRGKPDRIVVGVDGSPASERALQWAAEEADRHEVDLVVVHSWLYPYLAAGATSSPARDLTEVDASCLLESAVESIRDKCSSNVIGQLVESGPATGLLAAVRDGDLLVLGSRGRGSLTAGLFGSTVNAVLDRCAIPVVVVRGAHDPSEQ
ncbi:MAG: universal stress protein [Ilumatobacteraceae bacterium]